MQPKLDFFFKKTSLPLPVPLFLLLPSLNSGVKVSLKRREILKRIFFLSFTAIYSIRINHPGTFTSLFSRSLQKKRCKPIFQIKVNLLISVKNQFPTLWNVLARKEMVKNKTFCLQFLLSLTMNLL